MTGVHLLGQTRPVRRTDLERHLRTYDWSWSAGQIKRAITDRAVRNEILNWADSNSGDTEVVFRYVCFALFTSWRDEGLGLRCFPFEVGKWIVGGSYRSNPAGARSLSETIEYLQKHLPRDFDTVDPIPKRRVTLLRRDGLPMELKESVWRSRKSPMEAPVFVVSGSFDKVRSPRRLLEDVLAEVRQIPCPSSLCRKTRDYLNDLPADRWTRQLTDERLEGAIGYVSEMPIKCTLTNQEKEFSLDARRGIKKERKEELRGYYLSILHALSVQAKPVYMPSRRGRTDRLFSANPSVLLLPKKVRELLCEGLYEVDLKSAHLLIAAWLWDAESALVHLRDPTYCIWSDLFRHFSDRFKARPKPGEEDYEILKGAFKKALYSIVYGMALPNVKAEFTNRTRDWLGETAGQKLAKHEVLAELVDKRDDVLEGWSVGTLIEGPTGIQAKITAPLGNGGTDARSVMATLTQGVEHYLMRAIRDVAKEKDRFNVMAWIHDGAYVKLRSEEARRKDLRQQLRERCKEVTNFFNKDTPLPARFEIKQVTAPDTRKDNPTEYQDRDPIPPQRDSHRKKGGFPTD